MSVSIVSVSVDTTVNVDGTDFLVRATDGQIQVFCQHERHGVQVVVDLQADDDEINVCWMLGWCPPAQARKVALAAGAAAQAIADVTSEPLSLRLRVIASQALAAAAAHPDLNGPHTYRTWQPSIVPASP